MKQRALPHNASQPHAVHRNTTAAQRARVLDFLRKRPMSTLDAREQLDVLHPAARVMELRKAGHDIATHWSRETTAEGGAHRVARYVLIRSAKVAK